MSQDLFVRWGKMRPTLHEVQILLEDYLGKAAEVRMGPDGRLFAEFSSPSSNVLRRTSNSPHEGREERWFEVFEHFDPCNSISIRGDAIGITTRDQDAFVKVVSRGFAHLCTQVWGGITDP